MRLINMKELLSYWDISLGLIAIWIGIYKRYKLYINRKKSDEISKRKTIGAWKFSSYAKIKNESLEDSFCYLTITVGILFTYNRLNGNLPNIVIHLKELSTY